MATLTFQFSAVGGNATWANWTTHPTSPATEALSSGIPTTTLPTNNKNTTAANNTWTLTGTWGSIFGSVLAHALITGVTSASIQSKCTAFTTGGTTHTQNASTLVDGGTTITVGGTRSFTTTDVSFVTSNGVNATGLTLYGGDAITLTISNSLSNGNSNSATMALQQDVLVMTITYTPLPQFTNLSTDPPRVLNRGKLRVLADITQNLLQNTLNPPMPSFGSATGDNYNFGRKRTFAIDDDNSSPNLITGPLGATIPFPSNLSTDPARLQTRGKFRVDDDSFSQNLLANTLGSVQAPFPASDYTVPVRRKVWVKTDTPNLLNTLLTVVVPRTPVLTPVRGRKFVLQVDPPNLLTSTLGQGLVQSPFVPSHYEVREKQRRITADGVAPNLLVSTLAPSTPITELGQIVFGATPLTETAQIVFGTIPNNASLTELAEFVFGVTVPPPPQPPFIPPIGTPYIFRPIAVTNVRRRTHNAALEFIAANLLVTTLAAPVAAPFIPQPAEAIEKRPAIVEQAPPNLLTSTLAVTPTGTPFVPGQVTVLKSLRKVLLQDPANLLTTTLAPPVPYFPPNGTPYIFRPLAVTKVGRVTNVAPYEWNVQNLAVSITPVAQSPFVPVDYQVTLKRKFVAPENVTNLLPITQTLGFPSGDWPVLPKRRFQPPEDVQNSLVTVFKAANPFSSGDWTIAFKRSVPVQYDSAFNLPVINPLTILPPGKNEIAYEIPRPKVVYYPDNAFNLAVLNPLTILPPGQSVYFDIPTYRRKAVYYPDNAFNINIAPLVLPPGKQESAYQIPRRKVVYYPDNAFNLPVTNPLTILPPGKNETAYQISRRKIVYYPDNAFNLAIINPLSILPPGKSVFTDVLPRPKVAIETYALNLLTNTLVVAQVPFVSVDYGIPAKRRFVAPEDQSNLLLTAAVRPFATTEFPFPSKSRFVAHTDVLNVLPISQTLPFASGEYTVPVRHRFLSQDDVQNLLPLTQQLPFSSGDWQVGYGRKFNAFVDFNNQMPIAVELVPFSSGEQFYQSVLRSRVPYETFTTFNLPTATFIQPYPVGSATEQFVFKPRSRVLPEVYINLLTSTLIPPVLVSDPDFTIIVTYGDWTVYVEYQMTTIVLPNFNVDVNGPDNTVIVYPKFTIKK